MSNFLNQFHQINTLHKTNKKSYEETFKAASRKFGWEIISLDKTSIATRGTCIQCMYYINGYQMMAFHWYGKHSDIHVTAQ
jgi:hypothetical protein